MRTGCWFWRMEKSQALISMKSYWKTVRPIISFLKSSMQGVWGHKFPVFKVPAVRGKRGDYLNINALWLRVSRERLALLEYMLLKFWIWISAILRYALQKLVYIAEVARCAIQKLLYIAQIAIWTIQKLLYIEKLVAKRTIKTIAKVFKYINWIKKARFMKWKAIYDKIRGKRNIIINLSKELINDFYGRSYDE